MLVLRGNNAKKVLFQAADDPDNACCSVLINTARTEESFFCLDIQKTRLSDAGVTLMQPSLKDWHIHMQMFVHSVAVHDWQG